MALHTWLAFFIASWLISLSPGPGAMSCMAAGIRYGHQRALWNIVGLEFGVVFVLAVVGAGIGAVLAASAPAFVVVKWTGALYLIYLGVQQWRATAGSLDAIDTGVDGQTPSHLVLRGFLVNATNPKGILFMLAVLPQFIDTSRPQLIQYLICAATLVFTDTVVMNGYTVFAARVLALMRAERHRRWLNRLFGALFVAAGAGLATFRASG